MDILSSGKRVRRPLLSRARVTGVASSVNACETHWRGTSLGLLKRCYQLFRLFFSKVFSSRGHHWALRSDREWLAVAQEGVRAGIFLGRNS